MVGHVDHGKSTIVGRLLAETGSLPSGRLEQVSADCARQRRPLEYARLVDALREEKAQGITIETARVFLQSARRTFLIMDAPGHATFIRNMVTGAARADVAVLVVEAREGVRENTRRHSHLLWQLGLTNVVVLVNKMDQVAYGEARYHSVCGDAKEFLGGIGIAPRAFIPVSATEGDNIAIGTDRMPWYRGPTLLAMLDGLERKVSPAELPLRLPVQAVYRFGADGGPSPRIIAGRVAAGSLRRGDELLFLPSGQRSRVATIEVYGGTPPDTVCAGRSTGLTLIDPIDVLRGEIATHPGDPAPRVARRLRASIFWLDPEPMQLGASYLLKLATGRVRFTLTAILHVMDEAELRPRTGAESVQTSEVAECALELAGPLACDVIGEIVETARFVIVDRDQIRGGGIVLEAHAEKPEAPARDDRAKGR